MRSNAMAVGADDLTLGDLGTQALSAGRVHESRDLPLLVAEMIEVHHVRGVSLAAIHAGHGLGFRDDSTMPRYSSFPSD